jgi:hypothetical protein
MHRSSSSWREEAKIAQGETLGKRWPVRFPPRRGGVKSRHRCWIQRSVERAFVPPLWGGFSLLCLFPRAALRLPSNPSAQRTRALGTPALGYFPRLPTGADRRAAHGMADGEGHLELLRRFRPLDPGPCSSVCFNGFRVEDAFSPQPTQGEPR